MGKQAPDFSPSDNPAANCESSLTRLLTFLYLPAFNFWLLLSPRTLSFDWSMDSIPLVESILDPRCAIIVMFYGFLAILGFYCLTGCFLHFETSTEEHTEEHGTKKEHLSANRRKDSALRNGKRQTKRSSDITEPSKDSNSHPQHQNNNIPTETTFTVVNRDYLLQAAIISLAILILSFLPASNLFFYVGFVVAERILYIPSVGFCLLIAIGADIIWRACNKQQQRLFSGLLVSVFILSVARTVQRNWDWQNEETLYR